MIYQDIIVYVVLVLKVTERSTVQDVLMSTNVRMPLSLFK